MAENHMEAIEKRPQVAMTSKGFAPQTLDEAWRFSQALAKSAFVPQQYQGKPEDCMIALDLASRMNTHWLAIMQHVYIVHGRPGLDANLAIGMVNQSGQFEPIQYEVEGRDVSDPGYRVRAYSRRRGSAVTLYGPWIDWKLVKAEGWDSKQGSKWKTMPEQMFHYRAGSWWQKRHCPEMTLGMSTREELEDTGPVVRQVDSKTIEPTEGRQKFGFQEGQPQQGQQDESADEPEDGPSDTESLKACWRCRAMVDKRVRRNNHNVCHACAQLADDEFDRDVQQTSPAPPQQPATEQAGATETEGPTPGVTEPQEAAPAPVDGTEIHPETPCQCALGHAFPFSVAVNNDGTMVCPSCGSGFEFTGPPPQNASPKDIFQCRHGHRIYRSSIIKTPLAKPPQIGKCPQCDAQGVTTFFEEKKR